MSDRDQAFRARVDQVIDRVDIAVVVSRVAKLHGRTNLRGKCPFHGSKSDCFAVMVEPPKGGKPYARCWGCEWQGDVIKFVVDYYGLTFADALKQLEDQHGLDGLASAPVQREKVARAPQDRQFVESAELGRLVWKRGVADLDAIRTWFRARGVPDAMLRDDRLHDLRFVGLAPIAVWQVGKSPTSLPQAPAIAALIRRPADWKPIGVHVTYLRPDLAGKMERKRADGSLYPARKMCGDAAGGCVMLGHYRADVPLFPGEGNETVFSGMGLAEAREDACGLATLSLNNLQGQPMLARKGALPLYDLRPDPERPGVAFRHDGPVTVLIDADMKPLRGPIDRASGDYRGLPVIEQRGGPILMRAITTQERATICAELAVKAWRAAGCHQVRAMRPPMGMDFNDVGRAAA